MPKRGGFLPREGLVADPFFKLIGRTALNPVFLLPFILFVRYTKKGANWSILHEKATWRLKALFYFAVARWINRWYSDKVLNNFVKDKYVWSKEIVLVTGGAAGIGGEVVKQLSQRGIRVVVLDIQPMTFQAASNVYYFQCDITSTEQLAAVAREIREKVGHPTVLINNAGVARGKTLLDATPQDIRFTYDVNALAHYWTAKEFLPHMVATNHGMVVTVASTAAFLCVPNMVDYGATKAAVMAFHEGLAAELLTRYNAPRVRTVMVCQGYTKTPLFKGFEQGSPFLLPDLEPETVAEEIVKKVLSGTSGHIYLSSAAVILTALRAFPRRC